MNKSDLGKIVEVEATEYATKEVIRTYGEHEQNRINSVSKHFKSGASFMHGILQEEIEKLKAENQRFREALEYYANRSNWTLRDDVADCLIDDSDYEKKHSFLTSGKRARQALSPQKKEGG